MVAFPYTKRHCSQWNVNQSVAVLVCSEALADALGVPAHRRAWPLSAALSRRVLCLAEKPSLASHAGTVIAGRRALALAGLGIGDVDVADLYSCFPAAVRAFAADLGLPASIPWSVTGSMAFAGGPFNHGALDAVARLVERLREDAGPRRGLVSNLSGIFGKQAIALFGREAPAAGFACEDVTDEVAAAEPAVAVHTVYEGPARIAGCTVAWRDGAPAKAWAYCDTPDGARTVASSTDAALLARMCAAEYVGRAVVVHGDGRFEEAP